MPTISDEVCYNRKNYFCLIQCKKTEVKNAKFFFIEDDKILNASVCHHLHAAGYQTTSVYSYVSTKEKIANNQFDLFILDINLPDGNGIELCKEICALCETPIIILTAKDLEHEVIEGFDAGASDYVTKPFSMRIFLRRIAAILTRNRTIKEDSIKCGNLEINLLTNTLLKRGKQIKLTQNEWRLIEQFLRNRQQLLTRSQLLQNLWDNDGNFVDEHTLTTLVSRLRSKLTDNNFNYIKTYYGIGYRWVGEHNDD